MLDKNKATMLVKYSTNHKRVRKRKGFITFTLPQNIDDARVHF